MRFCLLLLPDSEGDLFPARCNLERDHKGNHTTMWMSMCGVPFDRTTWSAPDPLSDLVRQSA